MGTNSKGILEVLAYKARLPLQAKSAKVGMKKQFLELMVIPRYLYSLTFSIFLCGCHL